MSCEKNRHIKQGDFYDTSMFQYHHLDLNKLLSAEYLSKVVKHSIEVVLNDRKSEKLENNELILGVRCPRDEKFRLYQYETIKIMENNESVNTVNKSEIPIGKVAVIGLKQRYACKALSHFSNAINNGKDTAKEMHDFLAKVIDTENSKGSNSIGKPCVLYTFKGNSLEKKNTIY